jgi:hypothetical protein
MSEGLSAQYQTSTGKKQLMEKSNKLPGAVEGWNLKQKEETRSCAFSHLLFHYTVVISVKHTHSMNPSIRELGCKEDLQVLCKVTEGKS